MDLDDAFDQALGLCDVCRAGSSDPQPGAQSGAQGVRREFRAEVRGPKTEKAPSSSRPRRSFDKRLLLAAIAVLVLLVLAIAGWLLLDALPSLFGGESRSSTTQFHPVTTTATARDTRVDAISDAVRRWQPDLGELTGPAAAYLASGVALFEQDDVGAYARAARQFQRALVLDPGNSEAVAGYVTAIALGRGEQLPDEAYAEADALLAAARARFGRLPELLIAQSHLLLTRPRESGHAEDARRLAVEALGATDDARLKAAAHLAAGRAIGLTSAVLAEEHFETALTLDPKLEIALLMRALARERGHDDVGAAADLALRLQQNPGHWRTLETLTRVLHAAGQSERAQQLLREARQRSPDDVRPVLASAVLAYQQRSQDRARDEAVRTLRALAARLEALDPALRQPVLIHLAHAERVRGNRGAAAEAARRVLEADPAAPAAHLTLLLAALEQGPSRAGDAAQHLSALQGRLGDAALEKLLEGRVRLLQGRLPDAEGAFKRSFELDGRRTDARLWAGLTAAQAGRREVAIRYLHEAALADPLPTSPTPADPLLFIRPRELLRGAQVDVGALTTGPDDPLPRLYDAVLRYHQGDFAGAARLAERVATVDRGNALAHAWRALAAVRMGSLGVARKSAELARSNGRTLALAHFAHGVVLARQGETVEARRALLDALAIDGGLLGAEVELAELELASGDAVGAGARLQRTLKTDPSYGRARALLFRATTAANSKGVPK